MYQLPQDRHPPHHRRAAQRRPREPRGPDHEHGSARQGALRGRAAVPGRHPCPGASSPTRRSAASPEAQATAVKFKPRERRTDALASRPAGATAPRPSTWTAPCPTPSGASTAPSVPAPSTWPRRWPATPSWASPPSASTAKRSRTPTTTSIPDAVRQRLLDYASAGLAVAQMKGTVLPVHRSACPWVSPAAWSRRSSGTTTWACATSTWTWSEIERRIELGIYDEAEYEKSPTPGSARTSTQGEDFNPEEWQRGTEDHEEWWEYVHQDGAHRPRPHDRQPQAGRAGLRGGGRRARRARLRLPGSAPVDGLPAQRRPHGDAAQHQFDWNGKRQPLILATENDNLNGASMLFNYLLTNRAQIFSDVRTYWSADAIERVTGHRPEGRAAAGLIDLRNSGATTLDGTFAATDEDGNPAIKPWWEITDERHPGDDRRDHVPPGQHGLLPRRRLLHRTSARRARCRSP